MKKVFVIVITALIFFSTSCNIFHPEIDEKKSAVDDSNNKELNPNGIIEFNKTAFADRNEELIYIREYIKQKLPDYVMKITPPEDIEKIRQMLTAFGKDYTTRQLIDTLIKSQHISETFMVNVLNNTLSFSQVKDRLENLSTKQYNKGVKSEGNLPVVNYKKTNVSTAKADNNLQNLTDGEIRDIIFTAYLTDIKTIYKQEFEGFDLNKTTLRLFLNQKYQAKKIDSEVLSLHTDDTYYMNIYVSSVLIYYFEYNKNTKETTMTLNQEGD